MGKGCFGELGLDAVAWLGLCDPAKVTTRAQNSRQLEKQAALISVVTFSAQPQKACFSNFQNS
jgi:hypothetical protein